MTAFWWVRYQMLSILKIILLHVLFQRDAVFGEFVCLIVLQEASPYIHAKSHYFSIIWHYIEVLRAYGSVQGAGLLIPMSILSTSSPLHSETDDDEFWEISVSFSVPPWRGSGVGYQRAWDPGWVWVYVVCVHAFVAVFRALLVVWKYLCRYLCIEWRVAVSLVCCIEM